MSSSVHHVHAPSRLSPVTAQPAQMCIANLGNWNAAVEEVQSWPEYRPEPLRALPNRARELGLAELHDKDEASGSAASWAASKRSERPTRCSRSCGTSSRPGHHTAPHRKSCDLAGSAT